MKVRAFEAGSGCRRNLVLESLPRCALRFPGRGVPVLVFRGFVQSVEAERAFLPAQPRPEQWLNFVADRFDLKNDIQFNTLIESATYREQDGRWMWSPPTANTLIRSHLLACCGMLSAPLNERFPGQVHVQGRHHPIPAFGQKAASISRGSASPWWAPGLPASRSSRRSRPKSGR